LSIPKFNDRPQDQFFFEIGTILHPKDFAIVNVSSVDSESTMIISFLKLSSKFFIRLNVSYKYLPSLFFIFIFLLLSL